MTRNPYLSPAWPDVLHHKIDIFVNGEYWKSSNAYRSLKDARKGAAHVLDITTSCVTACYSEKEVRAQ